jgi:hypothetical protein
MLAAGVDLKVIQARLGHRDFATTANTYSHLLQNAQNEAVEKLAAMMKSTQEETEKADGCQLLVSGQNNRGPFSARSGKNGPFLQCPGRGSNSQPSASEADALSN